MIENKVVVCEAIKFIDYFRQCISKRSWFSSFLHTAMTGIIPPAGFGQRLSRIHYIVLAKQRKQDGAG